MSAATSPSARSSVIDASDGVRCSTVRADAMGAPTVGGPVEDVAVAASWRSQE